MRIFESELRGTQPVTYEERMRRKDGVYRWFLMRVRLVLNEQGRVHHWFGAATDIDDLKHMQQQQQLLVAELQHRRRNLLTVVHSIETQKLEGRRPNEDVSERFSDRRDELTRVQRCNTRSDKIGRANV